MRTLVPSYMHKYTHTHSVYMLALCQGIMDTWNPISAHTYMHTYIQWTYARAAWNHHEWLPFHNTDGSTSRLSTSCSHALTCACARSCTQAYVHMRLCDIKWVEEPFSMPWPVYCLQIYIRQTYACGLYRLSVHTHVLYHCCSTSATVISSSSHGKYYCFIVYQFYSF